MKSSEAMILAVMNSILAGFSTQLSYFSSFFFSLDFLTGIHNYSTRQNGRTFLRSRPSNFNEMQTNSREA